MKKAEAIQIARDNGIHLSSQNTTFASINLAKNVWWINIPKNRLHNERYILLDNKSELIVCYIPGGSLNEKDFRIKGGKQIDIELSSSKYSFLIDVKSGGSKINFSGFVVAKLAIK
ncbi:hypothetical protein [Desulfocurvus sp.]|uniref:hypothetical protein n=1 Tax=Desulfocurvus sp. TaxID=2871698 RepID=UPI0025BC4AC1|nr:hypothetical protein [Desulfocurvus sp.]MCK9241599.1 hypothetical protein [Desulfocurvus sp.]